MSVDDSQRVALQAKIAALEAQNHDLQVQLRHSQEDVFYLLRWLQQLQRDINDVYHSLTWRIGKRITTFILKILRRPEGPTAHDHIRRLASTISVWQQDYWRNHPHLPYIPWHHYSEYSAWLARFEAISATERAQMHSEAQQCTIRYDLILYVPPDYQSGWLAESCASIIAQIYPHWQLLCLLAEDTVAELPADTRIKILRHAPDARRADILNQALSQAQGDFIVLIDAHDRLAEDALYQFSLAARAQPEALLFYSDEDRLDNEGQRCDPYFKPDWSPDLFYAQPYLRRLSACRRTAIVAAGGFPACDGAEEYALLLNILTDTVASHIIHVDRVLYHARQTAPQDSNVHIAALRRHFHAQADAPEALPAPGGHARLRYALPQPAPLISLIIPTRDRLELLRGTVEGALEQTDYPALEMIVVDNGSREPATLDYLANLAKDPRVKVIRHDAPFNYSEINNLAAAHAQGELLAFLNNDLRIIQADWLQEMASQALRPEIGAVGAKLYYADDTVQHAGVVTGLGGLAGHPFKRIMRQAPGYQWRLCLSHNVAAVTAACLVLRREVFTQAGGFDEYLRVAFNDVDLCLRIRRCGYRILWTPYAELYHFESASRGMDDTPGKYWQLQKEITYMRQRWGAFLDKDPYYNRNLTLQYEDYGLAWPPSP
jgi:O-antigen biosynthesis protein